MKRFLIKTVGDCMVWGGRVFLGYNRLEHLSMIPLRSTVAEAIELYGEAVESNPSEEFPEATEHVFFPSFYHEAVIFEWNGLIHSITFWSTHAAPNQDLKCMLDRYSEGHQWEPLTPGYSFIREDREVRLQCSAMPAIGVMTTEYLAARAAFKEKNNPEEFEQDGDVATAEDGQ